jgi:hypothetical protein
MWPDLEEFLEIVEEVLLHVVRKSERLPCFISVTFTSARFCVPKEVYPTLWESTYQITITKNELALLLTGFVGGQLLETTIHRTVKGLSLYDIVSNCIELTRHQCKFANLIVTFDCCSCLTGVNLMCRGYHHLLFHSLRYQWYTRIIVCSLLVLFGTFRSPFGASTRYNRIRHRSRRTCILWP